MTTLAKEKINTENNVYIPSCIKKVDESKKYIYASMDNFDLNEESLDGKSTTHSMAIVVFQKA